MQMPTRKEGKIVTPFSKINKIIIILLLFVTFAFANIFLLRSEIELLKYYVAQASIDFSYSGSLSNYITMLVLTSLMEILVNELIMWFFYFVAYKFMRGMVPFSLVEFKTNFRPFIILRNIIWGLLSLLSLLPSGYFVSISISSFETISTVLILIPAFFYFKKYYIKEGYERNVLLSFTLPFLIINIVSYISSII